MFEGSQPLNPHAHSFIPSKKSEKIREMAAKSVSELWERKKANGEGTVTNREIAKLVGHFISIGYKHRTHSDQIKIQNYLNKKLLSSKIPAVRPIADLAKISSKLTRKRTKLDSFNVSKFQIPPVSFLLIAFWGLHRHEQAQRPLLSLPFRPDAVKDKIWSVDASDKKLWNKSCVSDVCACPPIFGYSVPSNFFGVLSHVHYSCPVQKIHLNHYSESTEGNEFILTDNRQHGLVDEQPFEDVEFDINIRSDVGVLKNQFETTLSGICALLAKLTEDPCSGNEDNEVNENHCYTSFWDDVDSTISHVPFFQQSRESLVDDDDHPLLKSPYMNLEEEVPLEVKEMIRKSLCPKEDKLIIPNIADADEKKVETDTCDPPCSVWCNSSKKGCKFEEAVNINSESAQDTENFEDAPMVDLVSLEQFHSKEMVEPINITLKRTENFEDVPMIDLVSLEQLESKVMVEPINITLKGTENFEDAPMIDLVSLEQLESKEMVEPINITLKPALNFCGQSKLSPRSSSFADCDFYYYETKFNFTGVAAHASNMTMSNYPVKSNLSGSWDSGFMSHSSSEEDVFGERCERDSMWKFVIGKDSLWKPLPECVETNDSQMPFPHKRVNGPKRQRCAS